MENVSVNPRITTVCSSAQNIRKEVNETCAVQVSCALNRSGAVIENYPYPDSTVATGKVRAFKARDGMFYIFAVPDMMVFLNNRYGNAENYHGSKWKMTGEVINFVDTERRIWDRFP